MVEEAELDPLGLDAVHAVVEGGVLVPLGGVEFAVPGVKVGGVFGEAEVVEVPGEPIEVLAHQLSGVGAEAAPGFDFGDVEFAAGAVAAAELDDEVADAVADDHDVLGGFAEGPGAAAVLDADGALDEDGFVEAVFVGILEEVDDAFAFAEEEAAGLGAGQIAGDQWGGRFGKNPGFERREAGTWGLQDGLLPDGER